MYFVVLFNMKIKIKISDVMFGFMATKKLKFRQFYVKYD